MLDVQPQGAEELRIAGGRHNDPSDDLLRLRGHGKQVQDEQFIGLEDHQGGCEHPAANLFRHSGTDRRVLEVLKIGMTARITRLAGGGLIDHGKSPHNWGIIFCAVETDAKHDYQGKTVSTLDRSSHEVPGPPPACW